MISRASRKLRGKVCLFSGMGLLAVWLWGSYAIAWAPADSDEPAELEVVIKREAIKLTDPRTYGASMHLDAVKTVDLIAPVDGYVRTVTAKAGQKIKAQNEAVRLDDTRAALVVKRARANHQAAQIEKKLAQAKNDADLVALAEARLDAAQADLDLAQAEAEMLVVRGPFAGELQRVSVVEGQFVRAGEKLATLIDQSRLTVEVPVERSAAAPGSAIDIKVEETPVKARVESVMALSPRFDALRELLISPASALVTVENGGGKFFAGQTVYSDLIPLTPVALVPSSAISNAQDREGNRKVQVLRENVIRNLNVRILAKVGTDTVFVSGRFNEGDEVIVSASRELADGTPLRALAGGSGSEARGSGKSGTPAGPRKTSTTTKAAAPGF